MFEAVGSPYLAPFDGTFAHKDLATGPPEGAPRKSELREQLEDLTEKLSKLQPILYGNNQYAVLLVFQAMDAAGKDGTIRAVLHGVNPAGCQVFSFKQPSGEELEHDFLWRTALRLPERGRIGVFNRSYYEEVLVVRVHPEFLDTQNLPARPLLDELWEQRFESIRTHERHLARSGTVVLKFWLNVSEEEQRERLLSRIQKPDKNWKFSALDVRERGYWHAYMQAYEEAIRATSRPWAPWYVIPADNKAYLRVCVADIVVRSLKQLDLHYPEVSDADERRFSEIRALLEGGP